MNFVLRRLAAAFTLATIALSWPMAFVRAQATTDYVVIMGDSQCRIATTWGAGSNNLAKLINDAGYATDVYCHGGAGLNVLKDEMPTKVGQSASTRGKNPIAIVVFAAGNGNTTAAEVATAVNGMKQYTSNIIWFGPYHAPDAGVMSVHQANHATISAALGGTGVSYQNDINIDPSLGYADKAHFTKSAYGTLSSRFISVIQPRLTGTPAANAGASNTGDNTSAATADEDVSGATTPTVPERSQSNIYSSTPIEVRCADTNPVFPIQLGISVGGVTEVNGLTEYINVVYRYMTAIVLTVAIVMITYGGFKYLMDSTSSGTSSGKDVIKDALIGMVLVLSSYVILNTLNPATTILQFTRPPADITCANYTANLGYNGTGPRRNEVSNCTTDADCSGTQKCLETRIVRNSDQRMAFWVGTTRASFSATTIKECSDGKYLAPCGSDSDCTGDAGLVCETNSWKLCIKSSNNADGGPCNSDSQCTNDDCASGYRNFGTTIEDAFTPNNDHDFAVCRGNKTEFDNERLVDNNWTIPAADQCHATGECEDTALTDDLICLGPKGSSAKACVPAFDDVDGDGGDNTICFMTANGLYPATCGTNASLKCVICKNGTRTLLTPQSDPQGAAIGACVDSSDARIGSACTGS